MRPLAWLREFETFAVGLDHLEGLAFDAAHTLWAGGEISQIYRVEGHGHACDRVKPFVEHAASRSLRNAKFSVFDSRGSLFPSDFDGLHDAGWQDATASPLSARNHVRTADQHSFRGRPSRCGAYRSPRSLAHLPVEGRLPGLPLATPQK